MKVLHVNDVEGDQLVKGAIRKILVYSENMMLIQWEADVGGSLSHSHSHEQMGFILKGAAELTAGGEKVTLNAGSSYLLEPNEHHAFKIVGDEKCILLDIFHPHREDYLPQK